MSNPSKKLKWFASTAPVANDIAEPNVDEINADTSQCSLVHFTFNIAGSLIQINGNQQTLAYLNLNPVEPVISVNVVSHVSTKLLDLNDNCLMKILESNEISIMDGNSRKFPFLGIKSVCGIATR